MIVLGFLSLGSKESLLPVCFVSALVRGLSLGKEDGQESIASGVPTNY
jgi:hypothetical protein